MNNTVERGGESLGSRELMSEQQGEGEEGRASLKKTDLKGGEASARLSVKKMCWLPIDQPLLRPGDSSCSARRRPSACSVAQLLASRLRSIGDQLEKSWTVRETKVGFVSVDRGRGRGRGQAAAAATRSSSRRLKGFLCLAVHVTLLVLLGARRHL